MDRSAVVGFKAILPKRVTDGESRRASARLDAVRLGRLAVVALSLATACGGQDQSGPSASGSLTVSGCVIPEGGSACALSISWRSVGALSPRVTLGDEAISTAPSGTFSLMSGPLIAAVTLLDGASQLDQRNLSASCAVGMGWNGGVCAAFGERFVVRAPTPFVENGRPVTLEVVIYKPAGPGPFATVVFHHGSTGDGTDPSLFTQTYTSDSFAQVFVERGFLVAFPQRRGRGASDGLYDEGFTPNRSGYSCVRDTALAGFEHAMADADAAVAFLSARPEVDPSRLVSAGVSRGGVLALTHAAERPGLFAGVINFVGGWLGEGCQDALAVNRLLFTRAGAFPRPTESLYGANDSFYSLGYSRGNFDAFVGAGGRGAFRTYSRGTGLNGHFIINDPDLWTADVVAYVQQILPS